MLYKDINKTHHLIINFNILTNCVKLLLYKFILKNNFDLIMSSTLYRKYRPLKFSEIVGQQHIVRTLSNSIANNHIGHAYLLTGPRGTGKTTLARIFAKTVNCISADKLASKKTGFFEPCLKCKNCQSFQENKFTDIIEIDAASNTGVDNIRDLKETAQLPPLQGKFKVYIIDEVHMLSQGAFNALLKILEEPPEHIIFILATTEIHKVPETIISRCQKFDFNKFSIDEIVNKLSKISSAEKIKIDDATLKIIATIAEGGMRDAESLLEQVISLEGKNINSKKVKALFGITENQFVEKLTELIFSNKPSEALLFINKIYKDGFNLEFFVKNWLEYLRKIMITNISSETKNKMFPELTVEQQKTLNKFSQMVSINFIILCIDKILKTIPEIKTSFIPQLPLETVIVKLTSTLTNKKNSTNGAPDNTNNNITNNQSENANKKTVEKKLSKKETVPTKNKHSISENKETKPTKKNIKTEKEASLENKKFKSILSKISTVGKRKLKKNKVKEIKPEINIYKIEEKWKEIIAEIRQENFSLSMMLTNSKPIQSKSSQTVNIAVLRTFHKELINKPENRLTIKDISNKITRLGFNIKAVTAEEVGLKLKTILPKETISQEISDNTSAKKESHQNSLLSDALSLMGGKVVEN